MFQPYTLVKDHRLNLENGNVQAVMDGDLDLFIDAALLQGDRRGRPPDDGRRSDRCEDPNSPPADENDQIRVRHEKREKLEEPRAITVYRTRIRGHALGA